MLHCPFRVVARGFAMIKQAFVHIVTVSVGLRAGRL